MKHKAKKRKKLWLSLTLVILILVASVLMFSRDSEAPARNDQGADVSEAKTSEDKKRTYKNFSGEEFKQLYDSIAYPNSTYISEKSPITNDAEADKRLRDLAVKRGYKMRSAPVSNNFIEVQNDRLLQPLAAKAWTNLHKAAKNAGVFMSITEAFRSADDQKKIFLNRLGNIASKDILAGTSDAAINKVLTTTALPGFSRHHTGYTIDLSCISDHMPPFEHSECFAWLSADNYKNAKIFGWIPSYPDSAGAQGPDPEAWEYVWVGQDRLME